VVPEIVQYLKDEGITQDEEIDEYFQVNFEVPLKEALKIFNEQVSSMIDNFDANAIQMKLNQFLDNQLKPFFNDSINKFAHNKTTIKPKIKRFIHIDFAKDIQKLVEEVRDIVKHDIVEE